ncbi:MAG: hypothetical protein CM15mP113_3400 [Pseudomonadota bacterium]|nr:MAG: hypothetical protein CM15mP113_3400 [Pseudomonadota bacterium]
MKWSTIAEFDLRIQTKREIFKLFLLGEYSYEACAKIYIQYCEYKQFGDMIPLFKEEFCADIAERIGYYDKDNHLLPSQYFFYSQVLTQHIAYFAWDYKNPKN